LRIRSSESLAVNSFASEKELIETIFEALKAHQQLFWLLGLGSIVLLIGTALLIPWLIIVLPADFFSRAPGKAFGGRHPVVIFALILLRNVLGAVLLVAGIIMLFVPGQGLLTILIALALIDLPGKHTLLLRMMNNRRVRDAANGIRRWAGKPEFLPAGFDVHGDASSGRTRPRDGESMRDD
jgi:hypothetical protein